MSDRYWTITIHLGGFPDIEPWYEEFERYVCPDRDEPDHDEHCRLIAMSIRPDPPIPPDLDGVPPALVVMTRNLVSDVLLEWDLDPRVGDDLADELLQLLYPMRRAALQGCVCNVGVQDCPVHPGRLRTQDEKIAFRKAWDA